MSLHEPRAQERSEDRGLSWCADDLDQTDEAVFSEEYSAILRSMLTVSYTAQPVENGVWSHTPPYSALVD